MKKSCVRGTIFWVTLACFALLGSSLAIAADKAFPLRAEYPKLTPIQTEELAAAFDNAVIVDARAEMEYNVVNIEGSHNIQVGKMQEADLLKVREKNSSKPLVFYCNGITCAKSYKAAEKAEKMGFTTVRVYDEGIFTWAQKQPARTKFFGKALTAETAKTAFISKEKWEATLLPTADFLSKAQSGYTVVDMRDPNERSEHPIKLPGMKVLAFDLLVSLLEKNTGAVPRTKLLVFDNVGKQVEWIQYYLEKSGVSDYYFLKGGVRQWVADGYDPAGKKS